MTVNKVAIITGASQGIGRATAVRLARDFSVVALVARNRDKLEETAADIRSASAMAAAAHPLLQTTTSLIQSEP